MSDSVSKAGSSLGLIKYKRERNKNLAKALFEADKSGPSGWRLESSNTSISEYSAPTPCSSPKTSSVGPMRGGTVYDRSRTRFGRARSEPYAGRGRYQPVCSASPTHEARYKAKYEDQIGVTRKTEGPKGSWEFAKTSPVVYRKYKEEDRSSDVKLPTVSPNFLGAGHDNGASVAPRRYLQGGRISLPLPNFTIENMKMLTPSGTSGCACERNGGLEMAMVNRCESCALKVNDNKVGRTKRAASKNPDPQPAVSMEVVAGPGVDDLDILGLTISDEERAADAWMFR